MTVLDIREVKVSQLDCDRSFYTYELALLEAIAVGETSFNRDDCPKLDDIDALLQAFADVGYVEKIVRAVYPTEKGALLRIDVVGGLTPIGETRRKRLAAK